MGDPDLDRGDRLNESTAHRWLHDLKPGDRMWFEGEIETIETITDLGGGNFEIQFVDRYAGVCIDGEWAVPDLGVED